MENSAPQPAPTPSVQTAPPVQTPPNQTPPPPTKKLFFSKKILWAIGGLVLFLLLIVILSPKKATKPVAIITPVQSEPTITPIPTQTQVFDCPKDPAFASDWQVLVNQKFFFCIKYPGNLFQYSSVDMVGDGIIAKIGTTPYFRGFNMTVTILKTDKNLEAYLSSVLKLEEFAAKSAINIDTEKGFITQHNPCTPSATGGDQTCETPAINKYSATVKHGNFIYNIEFSDENAGADIQTNKKIADQIISTFTFLDHPIPPDTTGWSLYTAQSIGYSIKYNPRWSIKTDPDGTTHFYPPNAQGIAKEVSEDPAKGIVPEIKIQLLRQEFQRPQGSGIIAFQVLKDADGISGNYYKRLSSPVIPVLFELPYRLGVAPDDPSLTIRITLISRNQASIDAFNRASKEDVQNADEATFQAMIQTLSVETPTPTPVAQ